MVVGNGEEGSGLRLADPSRLLFESLVEEPRARLDSSGRVVGWNQAIERLTGCPADQALGREAASFWPGWQGPDRDEGGRQAVSAVWTFKGVRSLGVVVTVARLDFEEGVPCGCTLRVRPEESGPSEGPCGAAEEESASLRAELERVLHLFGLQMDRMPLGCCLFDPEARIVGWNPAAERIFGYPRAEALGRRFYELLVPERAWSQVEQVERRLHSGDMSAHSVNENVTRDGRTILCRWTNTPLLDGSGRPMGCLSIVEDVTEPSRAGAELEASERLFRAVFDEALDGFLLADDRGIYTEANPAAGEIFGVEPGSLIGRSIAGFLGPEVDFGGAWAAFLAEGRAQGAMRLIRPDGQAREVEFGAVAGVLPGRHLSVLRDVTDWKRGERGLRESERLARSVLDALAEHIAVVDEEGTILQVNRAWLAFAEANGATSAVSEGVNYLKACDLGDGPEAAVAATFAQGIRDVLAGRRPDFSLEYPCDAPGRRRQFRGRVDPFLGEGPPRVVVSHLEVTDRKEAEDALKQYAGRLEILHSIERAILAARSPAEVAGTVLDHLARLIPSCRGSVDAEDPATGEIRRLADTRPDRSGSGEARYPIRIALRHDGKEIGTLRLEFESPPDEEHLEVLGEAATQLAIAIRQGLLAEQVAAAKGHLEEVSRRLILAEEDERRRIARELHDEVGQALTAVKLHIQAAREALDDPSKAGPRLEEGIGLVDRVLRQIRSISLDLRPSLLDDFGLVPALRSLVNTQARLGGFFTELEVVADDPEFRLAPELETACFRVAQESLTNVVRYARAKRVEVRIRRGVGVLELSVADDGAGFDHDAAMERASSGESFGLIGMRERVTLLGGRIEVRSSPGRGCRVLAHFPLAIDALPPTEPPP